MYKLCISDCKHKKRKSSFELYCNKHDQKLNPVLKLEFGSPLISLNKYTPTQKLEECTEKATNIL